MGAGQRFLTFDLGAESGRAVLGTLESGRLELREIHRFANEPQWILGRLHWDTVRLFAEIKTGLARCVRDEGPELAGIGVDTWGVDYALLDDRDELLGLPYHYRDHRTDGMLEAAFALAPRDQIYEATGIQFMQINTLYQLLAARRSDPELLDSARSLLFTPDLLNFWLTGDRTSELTIASTSQCYDPRTGDWSRGILARLDIPAHFFGDIIQPGTLVGSLHHSVCSESGAGAVPVIAPATHDTGSAVAGAPALGSGGWAYISCGTWSLVGVEVDQPVINAQSLQYNLTNEGGVYGTYRLLRNVMGLWLLQQCRRAWERAGSAYSYEELAAKAAGAPPFATILDPDDPAFLNPSDMTAAIAGFCERTVQRAPNDVASTVRCIIESLALKYRWVIERLEEVTATSIETIHVIGGGCQNRQLCQAAADACGRRVLAGPVEATAAGNIAVQAITVGALGSLAAARKVISNSFAVEEYLPRDSQAWEEPYRRLLGLLESG